VVGRKRRVTTEGAEQDAQEDATVEILRFAQDERLFLFDQAPRVVV